MSSAKMLGKDGWAEARDAADVPSSFRPSGIEAPGHNPWMVRTSRDMHVFNK